MKFSQESHKAQIQDLNNEKEKLTVCQNNLKSDASVLDQQLIELQNKRIQAESDLNSKKENLQKMSSEKVNKQKVLEEQITKAKKSIADITIQDATCYSQLVDLQNIYIGQLEEQNKLASLVQSVMLEKESTIKLIKLREEELQNAIAKSSSNEIQRDKRFG